MVESIRVRQGEGCFSCDMKQTLCLILFIFAFIFCDLSFSSEITEQEAKAMQAARDVFGGDFTFFSVSSSGKTPDAAFNALSKFKPSKTAKQLAKIIIQTGDKETKLLVYGVSEEKTRQVVIDALIIMKKKKKSAPGLHLLIVGSAKRTDEIKELCDQLSATFYYRRLEL